MEKIFLEIYEVPNYKGYFISEEGLLFSNHCPGKENIIVNGEKMYQMKEILDNHGYMKYNIKGKKIFKHRLVALTFLPNPNNYPIVNHLDSNPLNCHYSNLEWCTYKRNAEHKYESGYFPTTKKTFVYKNNVLIDVFPTLAKASKFVALQTGSTQRNIERRMQYKDYKIVIPENNDTLYYSSTAKHHFSSKEQKKQCFLYQNTTFLKSFDCKKDALSYCKENFGSSDGIRRNNFSKRHNLYLIFDKDTDILDYIKEIDNRETKKGKTNKKHGYLYHNGILVQDFSSVNKASKYCKEHYGCFLSAEKPYRNITHNLLFYEKEITLQEYQELWNDIIKKATYRPKTIW